MSATGSDGGGHATGRRPRRGPQAHLRGARRGADPVRRRAGRPVAAARLPRARRRWHRQVDSSWESSGPAPSWPVSPAALLDGREVDPSPDGVRAALARALPSGCARPEELPGLALLVDHYEQLTPVDTWMRQELLPDLPADGLTVLAGRHAPDPAWQRLPGWRELGTVLRLDCLTEAESGES